MAQSTRGQRPVQFYEVTETTSLARKLLSERLRQFDRSACAIAFRRKQWRLTGGRIFQATGDEIRNAAKSVSFYDCRDGSKYGQWTIDDIIHNGQHIRASIHGPGESARRVWRGPKGARISAVLLWDDFFGGKEVDVEEQRNVILHEMVHVISDWPDDEIFEEFQKDGLPHPDGTNDFTQWLRVGCVSRG